MLVSRSAVLKSKVLKMLENFVAKNFLQLANVLLQVTPFWDIFPTSAVEILSLMFYTVLTDIKDNMYSYSIYIYNNNNQ